MLRRPGLLRRALAHALCLALTALAVRPVVSLVRVLAGRLRYPYDLEWMEGASLVQALRLLRGKPLYTVCDHGFIPMPYPPGHFVALAALGKLFGLGYATGRALSVLALAACALILGREIWRACPRHWSAPLFVLFGLAAIAGGFPVVGGWYDLVRVDTLFVACLVGATALCAAARVGRARAALAAAALVAAVFTKQSAALYAPLLAWLLWRRDRRAAWWFLGTLALACGALFAWLQIASGGRFWITVFDVMASHPWVGAHARVAGLRLLVHAPFLLLVPVLATGVYWRGRPRPETAVWLGVLALALPQSVLSCAKLGAHVNNLMPAVVLAGPVTALLAAEAVRAAAHARRGRLWLGALLALAAALPLWLWRFEVRSYLPSGRDWRAARGLERAVAAVRGEVIAPAQPWLAVRAGAGPDQPVSQAYDDVYALRRLGFDPFACLASTPARFAILDSAPTSLMKGLLFSQFERAPAVHAGWRPAPGTARTRQGLPAQEDRGGEPGGPAIPALRASRGGAEAAVRPAFAGPLTLTGYRTRAAQLLERRPEPRRVRRRLLFDFESSDYRGWEVSGDAFAAGPARDPVPVHGFAGHNLASSFAPGRGDGAVGELRSAPFVLDRDYLGLRVGGGASTSVGVEIVVKGRSVFVARGLDSEVLVPVLWPVGSRRGSLARLVVRDAGRKGWQHVLIDDVELFDEE